MKISIIGHEDGALENSLANTTTHCCREHFDVTTLPVSNADVLWVCYDTPLGDNDEPDVEWVLGRIREFVTPLAPSLVLISSQLPVGTTAKLQAEYPHIDFAYSPENIRVATGIADFQQQARIVVGRSTLKHDATLRNLFAPFTNNLIFTDTNTAECCKHFLNAFLAMNIVFANEMAKICKAVGADPLTVAQSLRLERRISPKAPLLPGGPYGGGHLARDIYVLGQLAQQNNLSVPILSHIKASNDLVS